MEDLDFTVMFFQPLFQLMSKEVTVGLCGQGADELHAGYPRYTDLNTYRNLVNHRLGKMDLQLHGLEGEQWWNESHTPDIHTKSLKDFLEFEMKHGQLTNFQLRLVDETFHGSWLGGESSIFGKRSSKDVKSSPNVFAIARKWP